MKYSFLKIQYSNIWICWCHFNKHISAVTKMYSDLMRVNCEKRYRQKSSHFERSLSESLGRPGFESGWPPKKFFLSIKFFHIFLSFNFNNKVVPSSG